MADNLNNSIPAKQEVFAHLRSADERHIALALEQLRVQCKSPDGVPGLLGFFRAMLDVMGGDLDN